MDSHSNAVAAQRGRWAEDMAASFLQLHGLEILDRNCRAGGGEIDIIAREGRTLVFVEVRLREKGSWTSAAGSIGLQKRRRLRSCARELLIRRSDFSWEGREIRFDVVAMQIASGELSLEHLRQAGI